MNNSQGGDGSCCAQPYQRRKRKKSFVRRLRRLLSWEYVKESLARYRIALLIATLGLFVICGIISLDNYLSEESPGQEGISSAEENGRVSQASFLFTHLSPGERSRLRQMFVEQQGFRAQ